MRDADLNDDAFTRINQDNHQRCRRSTCDHIARILLMPRRIRDNELSLGCREITVSDVDRNALLALSF